MSLSLETSLSINAPVEKVWQALTDADLVRQYFFGTNLVTDWKVGSPIYFRGEYEGKAYEDKGVVLEFVPQKSLRYSYLSSWSGKPDLPENYAVVGYSVEATDGQTTVTVTQDSIENEEARAHSEKNWQWILGEMKKLVEG